MDGQLILVGLAGFLACLVDGALGMGFGPTASSILLGAGLTPAAASATVNLAKVVTGLASAISHWRFGNVDRGLVLKLALPGMVGALIGVTLLASIDGDVLRPILAALLFCVAVRILVRYSRPAAVTAATARADEAEHHEDPMPEWNQRGTEVVAGAGGVTNGLIGAWGPVVTPFLLQRGLPPRFAIGSVNTAEVAVAVVAAGSLFASLGSDGVQLDVALAMLIGGVIAAPIAAYVIRFLPPRGLGVAVAGLLMVTNLRELANWAGVGVWRWAAYAVAIAVCLTIGLRPVLAARSSRAGSVPKPNGIASS